MDLVAPVKQVMCRLRDTDMGLDATQQHLSTSGFRESGDKAFRAGAGEAHFVEGVGGRLRAEGRRHLRRHAAHTRGILQGCENRHVQKASGAAK